MRALNRNTLHWRSVNMATNGYTQGPPNGNGHEMNGAGRGKFVENGREYSLWHRGRYLLPVDELEMDRLDAMHKFFLVARNYKLCSSQAIDLDDLDKSPPDPQILDLGCGTGIWALDVAKKFWDVKDNRFRPGRVEGFDLCLDMQPQAIYPNSALTFADIEEPWPQEASENSRNLIHSRMLAGSIASWPRLYSQIFRHLIPGTGWIEQVEIDWNFANDSGPVSPRLRYWMDELLDAMDRTGRPMRVDPQLTMQTLANTGFVDIKQEVIRVRVNGGSTDPYEIDVGRWFNLCLHKGFMGMSLAPLVKVKGWTPEIVKSLQDEVLREVGERTNASYCKLYIFTARRPASNFR